MASGGRGSGKSSSASGSEPPDPEQIANVSPQNLYPTSDIRFVMMELGGLKKSVERLIDDVKDHGKEVTAATKSIDRFRIIIITAGVCLGIFLPTLGTVLWWSIGERINFLLKPSTQTSSNIPISQSPPVQSQPALQDILNTR